MHNHGGSKFFTLHSSFPNDCSDDEPEVSEDGCKPAVVVRHDAEAFLERGLMVACRRAFVEVVGEHKVGVDDAKSVRT